MQYIRLGQDETLWIQDRVCHMCDEGKNFQH